jgi:hypothetical protein
MKKGESAIELADMYQLQQEEEFKDYRWEKFMCIHKEIIVSYIFKRIFSVPGRQHCFRFAFLLFGSGCSLRFRIQLFRTNADMNRDPNVCNSTKVFQIFLVIFIQWKPY